MYGLKNGNEDCCVAIHLKIILYQFFHRVSLNAIVKEFKDGKSLTKLS